MKFRILTGLSGALLLAFAVTLAAQQDDPFAVPGEEGYLESPFDMIGEFDESASPFEEIATEPSPQEMESPFDDPSAIAPAPDPFDVDPFDTDPFDAAPDSPFDFPADDRPLDPFAATPAPTPAPAVRTPEPPRRTINIPLGRHELQYDDFRLRRLAEIRGLYVSAGARGFQSPAQIEQLLTDFRAGGFNRIYAEARIAGGTAYNSELGASFPYVTTTFANPLGDIREELGEYAGLIAVVSMLPAHNAALGSRPAADNPISRFPDFENRTIDGRNISPDNFIYLDPGNPLVRTYLSAVIVEIDQLIEPAGYLLTGLRYPGKEWGYSEDAVRAFREEVGGQGPPPPDDPVWSAWRRRQIDDTIYEIQETLAAVRPGVPVGVLIEVDGPPPASWNAYTSSDTYAERMQDWIGWCQDGMISEITFRIHERLRPQDNILPAWINFANNHVGEVRPVVSLSGHENLRAGLTSQFHLARERAVGTILYSYTNPARDVSRGFFASLPETLFRGAPGQPIGGRSLSATPEDRQFAALPQPPPSVERITPTPRADMDPLRDRQLVFDMPTPIPTRTPVPAVIPDSRVRTVTLMNGNTFRAVILEAYPDAVTLRPAEQADSPAVMVSRSVIRNIEPAI